MLWSLFKIVLFVALVGLATFGAGFLMENGGAVRISLASIELSLSPLAAAIGAAVLVFVIWLIFRAAGLLVAVLRFLNGDETALSRYFDRNRERKGFQALADGMMALASGEGRVAMAKAARAEKFLGRPELTNLLSAQAAEMSGDRKKALEIYKRLLVDDRTRFVGVRGVMKQKLAEGDTTTAMRLAEKALALKPKHVDTQDTLLRLQADHEDWAGARKTLMAKLKSSALPRDVHRRRDAVLAYAEARDALGRGETDVASKAAVEANRLSPDLVPAAVLTARMYGREGKPKLAAKVISKAWAATPHPELAAAFAEIMPDETPTARIKRFRPLMKAKLGHPEARMLAAELQIAADDFPAARQALGDLAETGPTARSLTLMAAIERGDGAEDSVVRGWLAKAVSASRGPQWTCGACNHIHGAWVPVCENCKSFDTLAWIEPPASDTAAEGQAAMLPLIVGALEKSSKVPDEPVGDDMAQEIIAEAEIIDGERDDGEEIRATP